MDLMNFGQIVMTDGIKKRFLGDEDFRAFIIMSVPRHHHGDWGDICADDWRLNQEALEAKGMILSSYHQTKTGEEIWIITDPGHLTTTILFPAEY